MSRTVAQLEDNLVKKVSYTASLITNVKAIDPLLDTLRRITSRTKSSTQLDKEDEQALVELQSKLETHLLKHEKVRFFTRESLQLQIQQYLQGEDRYASSRRLLLILIGVSTAITLLTLFVPLDGTRQHAVLASTTAFSLIQLSAAWLFLSALKSFQSKIRQAFLLICIGVAGIGVSSLAQPVIEVMGLHGNPYVSGAQAIPILIAASLLTTGIYLNAKLSTTPSRVMSLWRWFGVFVAFSIFTWFGPHNPYSPEWLFDAITTAYAWMTVESIMCAALSYKIWRDLPEVYKPPARAFFQACLAVILGVGYLFMVRFWAGPSLTGLTATFGFVLLSIMGIMFMWAGYNFNKISRY